MSAGLTDAELGKLAPDALRVHARRILPGYSSATLAAMPPESLLVDMVVARYQRDADLLDNAVLGHAHGHSPLADEQLKTEGVDQLVDSLRSHVDSIHKRRVERVVERANREAKAHFVDAIRQAVEERITTDPALLGVVLFGDTELEALVAESMGADDGDHPLDLSKAVAAIQSDPTLTYAVKLAGRSSDAAYSALMEMEPERTAAANLSAREVGYAIMDDFERSREREVEEIETMLGALLLATPAHERNGGTRGVLMDLQHETYDREATEWTTFRTYGWTTYEELGNAGRDVVAKLKTALEELMADTSLTGRVRVRMAW